MGETVMSLGQIKEQQRQFDTWDFLQDLGNALTPAAEYYYTHMENNDPDVVHQRNLGQMIHVQMNAYQNAAINQMQASGMMSAQQAAAARQAIIENIDAFERDGAIAQQRLGQMTEGYIRNARLAQGAGAAMNLAELGKGVYDAYKAGTTLPLAMAVGNLVSFGIGAELAGVLGGVIGAMLGLAGLPLFLFAAACALLSGIAFKGLFGQVIGEGWQALIGFIGDLFSSGQNWFPRRDPLTLDLDGDGIESIGINPSNPITFDHDGDGVRTGTGWISADDGFLVMDRNGNGSIDSGRELFGDSTPVPGGTAEDGFAALAVEDTNGDGIVDASDARFANLRVWRDLNQNGTSDPGELLTLAQLGIVGINVGSVERNHVLSNGNQIADVGTYIRSDGTEGTVGETHGTADVDLAENTFHRQFTDQIPLVEGVQELPNSPASGRVRDLWEAASLSPALFAELEAYDALTTREAQLAAIDDLLLAWARTADMKTMEERADDIGFIFGFWKIGDKTYPGAGGPSAVHAGSGQGGAVSMPAEWPDPSTWEQVKAEWDALAKRTNELFEVLEAFNGRYFFAFPEVSDDEGTLVGVVKVDPTDTSGGSSTANTGPPGISIGISNPQLDALNASYRLLRESIYTALVVQTRLEPVNDLILVHLTDTGIYYDFTDVEAEFVARIAQDPVSGMADLLDYARAQRRDYANFGWDGWAFVEQQIRSLPVTAGLQALYDEFGITHATASTSWINVREDGGVLLGSPTRNLVNGSDYDDAMLGGDGNDTLDGENGGDSLYGQSGDDSLRGGAGDDVLVGGIGNDGLTGGAGNDIYVFNLGDGDDSINNSDSTPNRTDTLKFGPGIRPDDIIATRSGTDLILSIRGTSDSVRLQGFYQSANYQLNRITFHGDTSWDQQTIRDKTQYGTSGADTLVAHASGSTLYGIEGDDILTGGIGKDRIEGGNGNDQVNAGDGDDVIYDTSGQNTLEGGAGDDVITGAGTLIGGTGNDALTGTGNQATQYIFSLGDGKDTIYDDSAVGPDIIVLGAGITAAGATLVRSGNDLTVKFNENDEIKFLSWFVQTYFQNNELRFADGTVWTNAFMRTLLPQLYVATEADETINGWDGIDIVDGGAGNDRIIGRYGADQLSGGDGNDDIDGDGGNDTIYGGAGNDSLGGGNDNDTLDGGDGDDVISDSSGINVLRGGAGNDVISGVGTMEGGTGNDTLTETSNTATTYIFNLGDGADTIYDDSAVGPDLVMLGAGITPSAVTLIRSGNDLIFKFNENDQINFRSWFVQTYFQNNELRFADGTVWNQAALKALVPQHFDGSAAADDIDGWDGIDLIDGGAGNDTISGKSGADQLSGGDGDDVVNGDSGDDTIRGDAGNDTLAGSSGNDTIEGGDGNDAISDTSGANLLRGGAGNDTIYGTGTIEGGTGNDTITGTGNVATTYLFNLGDGSDTIYDDSAVGPDVVILGAGITPAAVTLVRSGNDLIFKFNENDQIRFVSWYVQTYFQNNEFRFADGTVWNQAVLQTLVPQLFVGTAGADTINGSDGLDAIDGGAGNDTLSGKGGADQLWGGDGDDVVNGDSGDDTIYGDAGNDSLAGGSGNDTIEGGDGDDAISDGSGTNVLRGGAGNDTISGTGTIEGGAGNDTITGTSNVATTYLFNLGDGSDTIYDDSAVGPDIVILGAGIAPAAVTLIRSGNDLIFKFNENDQINFRSWYVQTYFQNNEFRFADGTVWNAAALEALVPQQFTGTAGADTINGWDGIDIIDGGAGNDTLSGKYGADQLSGGDGDDTINGDGDNDFVFGGAGNDTLNGGSGSDTVDGGDGDDSIGDTSGSNVLRGGAGNDTIYGTGTIEGGTGNDTITGTGNVATTYIYDLGDGADAIYDDSAVGPDVILLGAGITPASVTLIRSGNDLTFKFNETDQIKFLSWYVQTYFQNNEFRFADGTVWNAAVLEALVPQQYTGTTGADTINGWDGIDLIDGGAGNDTISGKYGADQLWGGEGNDTISGDGDNDFINGGAGNDTLSGNNGSDTVEGGEGDDIISDTSGANVLRGGAGNDTITGLGTLEGGTGNDTLTGTSNVSTTYVFNLGDGSDTIYDDSAPGDTLILGAGITPSMISLVRSGNDLTFRISDTDQVKILSWYNSTSFQKYTVQFADGTVWNAAALKALVPQLYNGTVNGETINGWDGIDLIDGGAGNDTISGKDGADQLWGGDGNDTVSGDSGNDFVYGGAGNDTLSGNNDSDTVDGGDGDDIISDSSGSNVLRGGAGNDTITGTGTLAGGTGNDALTGSGNYATTYLFDLGDGIDTINDSSGPTDTVILGAGISPSSITLVRSGNDLTFRISDTDQIKVLNWFTSTSYQHKVFQFADGTVWNTAAIAALVPQLYTGTASGETINGWEGIDLIDGSGGNDTIDGNEGDDQLAGGDGDDNINGDFGNDLVVGGAGNDTLNGYDGNDLLQGNGGDDALSDSFHTGLFDGGAGTDTLTGNSSRQLFAGGAGNDTITTSTGADIVAFNRGDGADIVVASTGADNTISLGGGIAYSDIALRKNGNDLVVEVGAGESVTLQNWYASTSNRSVINLQVIAEAMAAFNPGGGDPMLDNKVENFNFANLVARFDQERTANPALTSWAVVDALLTFQTGGSNTAALGGDLAYQYGLHGTFNGIGVAAAQNVINASTFGSGSQALNSQENVYTGVNRLT